MILALITFFCTCGRAQNGTPDSTLSRYDEAIVTTRNAMLERYADYLPVIDSLVARLPHNVHTYGGAVKKLQNLLWISPYVRWPYDPANYREGVQGLYSSLALTPFEVEAIARLRPLIDLTSYDLLQPKRDFPLEPLGVRTRTELRFFDIQPDDVVAEIGAGPGTKGLWRAAANPTATYWLTEIDEDDVRYMRDKVAAFPELYDADRVKVVLGDTKNTNLPAGTFTKVIIRNTFHHFRKTNAMMKSIRLALQQNGVLLISEPHLTNSGVKCKQLRPVAKTIVQVERAGFRLEEHRAFMGWHYLRFVRK